MPRTRGTAATSTQALGFDQPPLSVDRRAEPVHQRHEIGKARRDRARIVDPHGLARGQARAPETPSRCGGRAASRSARRLRGGSPVPSTIRSSPSTCDAAPQAREALAMPVEPVAFLDPQFGEAAHDRAAACAQAAATARIGYSSIIDGARSGGMSAPLQRAGADTQIGDRLAALDALVLERDIGAHLVEAREQPGARRVEPDIRDRHLGARHDQRRDERERGRGRVARHGDRRRGQLGLALDRDAAAAVGIGLDPDASRRNGPACARCDRGSLAAR